MNGCEVEALSLENKDITADLEQVTRLKLNRRRFEMS